MNRGVFGLNLEEIKVFAQNHFDQSFHGDQRDLVWWEMQVYLSANDCASYSAKGPKGTPYPHCPWKSSLGTSTLCPGPHLGSARPPGACTHPCLWPWRCGQLVSWTVGSVAGCQLGLLHSGPQRCHPTGNAQPALDPPHGALTVHLSSRTHSMCALVYTHTCTQNRDSLGCSAGLPPPLDWHILGRSISLTVLLQNLFNCMDTLTWKASNWVLLIFPCLAILKVKRFLFIPGLSLSFQFLLTTSHPLVTPLWRGCLHPLSHLSIDTGQILPGFPQPSLLQAEQDPVPQNFQQGTCSSPNHPGGPPWTHSDWTQPWAT